MIRASAPLIAISCLIIGIDTELWCVIAPRIGDIANLLPIVERGIFPFGLCRQTGANSLAEMLSPEVAHMMHGITFTVNELLVSCKSVLPSCKKLITATTHNVFVDAFLKVFG